MMSKVAWGLDLAGFSTGKSALAHAKRVSGKSVEIEVFLNHPFANKKEGRDSIAEQLKLERACIKQCMPMYIDMPIDLQNLPGIEDVNFSWQLTKRAIDVAYSAMPPFADRIGSPVARLQAVLGKDYPGLNSDYFETYPNMSLHKWLGHAPPSYKNNDKTADWEDDQWVGETGLADLLNTCGFCASSPVKINDDHFDACLCALVGVVGEDKILFEESLREDVENMIFKSKKFRRKDHPTLKKMDLSPPKGYRIIGSSLNNWSIHLRVSESFASDETRNDV
jgi:hypothetical protein